MVHSQTIETDGRQAGATPGRFFCLLFKLPSYHYYHVTPLLRDILHWLPVSFRIEYKLCLLVFLSLHGAAPEYLRDCCIWTHSSASGLRLRSLEKTDLRVRRMRTHFGDRAFSAAGPRCWNSLPPAIRLADSVDSFKVQLKTYLFAQAYHL